MKKAFTKVMRDGILDLIAEAHRTQYRRDEMISDIAKCRECGSDRYQIRAIVVGYKQRLFVVECGDCKQEIIPVLSDYFAPQDEVNALCRASWNKANAIIAETEKAEPHPLTKMANVMAQHEMARELTAAPQPEQKAEQEPVLFQYRARATWAALDCFGEWIDCTEAQYADYIKTPVLNDWEYEVRALYAAPVPAEKAEPEQVGPKAAEPFCYVLPGEDMANDEGFIDARIWKEGEFTRPLYAAPIPCPKCAEKDAEIARLTKELDTVCERCESAVIQSDAGIIAQQAEEIARLKKAVDDCNITVGIQHTNLVAYQQTIAQQAERIKELTADRDYQAIKTLEYLAQVEVLRDVVETIVRDKAIFACWRVHEAEMVLALTAPDAALKAHDAALIEKCAKVCDEQYCRDIGLVDHLSYECGTVDCAAAIRALAEGGK